MQETRRNSAFCDARVKGGEGGVRIGGFLSHIGHQSDTQDFSALCKKKSGLSCVFLFAGNLR